MHVVSGLKVLTVSVCRHIPRRRFHRQFPRLSEGRGEELRGGDGAVDDAVAGVEGSGEEVGHGSFWISGFFCQFFCMRAFVRCPRRTAGVNW